MLTDQICTPQRRLSLWKEFKEELVHTNHNEQLKKVATFFSRTPIGSRSLDYYTPDDWSTPWEILYNSLYCRNSISLLIYYTLVTMPYYKDATQLWLIDDGEDRYLLPVVNDRYILNYELGSVSTLEDITDLITVVTKFNNNEVKQYT